MRLRHFILGLAVSFGFAWMAIIVIPFFAMKNLPPAVLSEEEPDAGVYFPKRSGRIADGAQVYAENGCYNCHTQVVRPTYAGNDLFRPDWGGSKSDPDRGDTRRETNAFDFGGEKFAQIGVNRIGPDLSNLGRRVEADYNPADPAGWLYAHLYHPRLRPDRSKSTCPPFRFLFDEHTMQSTGEVKVTPNSDAKALVSYLLSLKKDGPVPASLDFARGEKKAAK